MITWRMAAAWVLALTLVTVLTWQIVGLADSQVGETPVAVAPSPAATAVGDSTSTSVVTSTSATSPTTTVPGPTSSSSANATATSTASSNPSTSSSSSSSSTSAPSAEWSFRSIASPGGTVVVRYRPEEVELQAATPAPGFSVEVEDNGPTRVRVDFESDAADIRVEARWRDGGLDVEIDD